MKEKKMEDLMLDEEAINAQELVPIHKEKKSNKATQKQKPVDMEEPICCLRNERVIVRFLPKENALVNNPKHILYGGMADGSVRYYVLPQLSSGKYINPLTSNEKAYLEEVMGLEYNSLTIYSKTDNYWDNLRIRLIKGDNYLDLSNPEDYIKYKVLLANKDLIAPSLQELQDRPKSTYQYVIIMENEESKVASKEMNATMESYLEFGKISDDLSKLRVIVETLDGRPTAPKVKIEFLQSLINKLIQADSKMFLRVIKDPLLDAKVLLKRAIEGGLVSKRGNYLYLKLDNSPLCEASEEPTLNFAARYITSPKHLELKLSLEAKLKN